MPTHDANQNYAGRIIETGDIVALLNQALPIIDTQRANAGGTNHGTPIYAGNGRDSRIVNALNLPSAIEFHKKAASSEAGRATLAVVNWRKIYETERSGCGGYSARLSAIRPEPHRAHHKRQDEYHGGGRRPDIYAAEC